MIPLPNVSGNVMLQAITGPVKKVTTDKAWLTCRVLTTNRYAVCWMEYGKYKSLDKPHKTGHKHIKKGTEAEYVFKVSGLLPDTLYYYKVVSVDETGRSAGSVYSFRTEKASR